MALSEKIITKDRLDTIKNNAKIIIKSFGYTQLVNNDTIENAIIDIQAESVITSILNFCNIEKYPIQLDLVASQRIAGEYLYSKNAIGEKFESANDGMADGSAFKKITEGDTTVERFGTDSTSYGNKINSAVSNLKTYGQSEVIRFRCLKW